MGNLDYKIIDNFLEKDLFENFKNEHFSDVFPWYYHEGQATANSKDGFFFYHYFFKKNMIVSPLFDVFIVPILGKLSCKYLHTVRANLSVNRNNPVFSDWHKDTIFECFTGILYINDNNGYTLLDKKQKIKIESVENRMLIFNSQIEHCAVSQTDLNRRGVINFNYV